MLVVLAKLFFSDFEDNKQTNLFHILRLQMYQKINMIDLRMYQKINMIEL